MELHAPARVMRRIAQVMHGRLASEGCQRRPTPPCPECEPAPQPQCRAEPQKETRALRVVCCPPSRGKRPPCPTPTPAPPRTCHHVHPLRKVAAPGRKPSGGSDVRSRQESEYEHSNGTRTGDCREDNDRVARRHAKADLARRRDYEREVSDEKLLAKGPLDAPSTRPYVLAIERECPSAIRGRQEVLPRCGPDRKPPAPSCVTLPPDHGCQIDDGARVDPCAHRPRILFEIDRSRDYCTPLTNQTTEPLCKLGQSSEKVKVDEGRPGNGVKSTTDKNRVQSSDDRVNVPNWCKDPPKPVPELPKCRQLTLIERLQNRVANERKPPGRRNIHTFTPWLYMDEKSSDLRCSTGISAKIVVPLTDGSFDMFKAAGLSRIASPCGSTIPIHRKYSTGGWVDSDILIWTKTGQSPGWDPVNRESDDPATDAARGGATFPILKCAKDPKASESSAPWLSLGKIKKKVTGCLLSDEVKSSEKKKVPKKEPSVCSKEKRKQKSGEAETQSDESNPPREPRDGGRCGSGAPQKPPPQCCARFHVDDFLDSCCL